MKTKRHLRANTNKRHIPSHEEKQIEPSQSEQAGNTRTACDKYQRFIWTFTMDTKDFTSEEQLSQYLNTFCKRYIFQKERGVETGYEHWQGAISLINKEYFATIKNLLGSAHIEPARNPVAAFRYCAKDDATKIGATITEKTKFVKTIKKEAFYTWQKTLYEILMSDDICERTVHWIYDVQGNIGKTAFCKYLRVHHQADYITGGAGADIAYALSETPRIVLLDFPRTKEGSVPYPMIEQIKNGMVFCPKYKSILKEFNSPHVVCFANFEPDRTKLSEDRWSVWKILADDESDSDSDSDED